MNPYLWAVLIVMLLFWVGIEIYAARKKRRQIEAESRRADAADGHRR